MLHDDEKRRQWGRLSWDGPRRIEAGTYHTFVLRYVAGSLGIDEGGGLRLSFRDVADYTRPQMGDPTADGYVTATGPEHLQMALEYSRKGNIRPYRPTLFVHILDGALDVGEEVTVVLGDRRAGSRGLRAQTFAETNAHLRAEVDPFGTHDYVVLPDFPVFDIVPGKGRRYRLQVPSEISEAESCQLRVKCEDVWGNPLRQLDRHPGISVITDAAPATRIPLAAEPTHDRGVLSYALPPLAIEGTYRFLIEDGDDGIEGGQSNPLVVRPASEPSAIRHYWCDFHGQTGETIGTGTVDDYFSFARHLGFLDGSCHQANDFQVDEAIWRRIVDAANRSNDPGAFVAFPGIEWSGTTPMGGDHNIIFHEDSPPLYRCSGWLASDGAKAEEVAPLARLYEVLGHHRAMTVPHVGGRPAAFTETHPALERVVELHSAWGTFEWVYERAFANGFKVGFVCNSDGHKARPGASYPGASTFGTLGGLTCVLASERTRDAFWDALQQRRCYGTTGQRILIDIAAEGRPIGSDLVVEGAFEIGGTVVGTAPLVSVELLQGSRVIDRVMPATPSEDDGGGDWVMLRLGGSRVYGRGRAVDWSGSLTIEGNAIDDVRLHGVFNPLHGIERHAEDRLDLRLSTSGHSVNLCLKLRTNDVGTLRFDSRPTQVSCGVGEISRRERRLFEAPVDQFLSVQAVAVAALPWQQRVRFVAPPPDRPETPYFVRVRQIDEAKAWTSPFYVTRA